MHSINSVLSWSEVLKNYSVPMLMSILSMQCEWESSEKCAGLFKSLQADMLLYTPLKAYKNSDMAERKSRWIQILKSVV